IESFEQQRAVCETYLDPVWLNRYQSMKNSVENPAVPVIDGQCSACFYTLLPKEIIALERQRLLNCNDCYRFLFKDLNLR
ncbi:MAG TPA: hypothetical protein VHA52_04060, partial [Candidatus Babeliaceae bacterium]|nr:hypothetical protein [Candidatus Babeliaceae bacterium]